MLNWGHRGEDICLGAHRESAAPSFFPRCLFNGLESVDHTSYTQGFRLSDVGTFSTFSFLSVKPPNIKFGSCLHPMLNSINSFSWKQCYKWLINKYEQLTWTGDTWGLAQKLAQVGAQ